jgi:hypothetical protein
MNKLHRGVLVAYIIVVVALLLWVPWSATVSGRTFRLPYGPIWSGPSVVGAGGNFPDTLPADFDFAGNERNGRLAAFARPDYGRIGLSIAIATCGCLIALLVVPFRRPALVPTLGR